MFHVHTRPLAGRPANAVRATAAETLGKDAEASLAPPSTEPGNASRLPETAPHTVLLHIPERDQHFPDAAPTVLTSETVSTPQTDGARVAEAGNMYVGRMMDDRLKAHPRVRDGRDAEREPLPLDSPSPRNPES